MSFVLGTVLLVLVLFGLMLLVQEGGRRLGERHRRLDPSRDAHSHGPTEAAVFALLGLFLAFTFSAAGTRFDLRRHQVVQEANAIGTAFLRIDVLPAEARLPLRQLFRDYVDARLEIYRLAAAGRPYQDALSKSALLQRQIWLQSTAAAEKSGQVPPFTVLLPALNEMIDITTTRTAATRMHSPIEIYLTIGLLAVLGAAFVGYGMAGRKVRSFIHTAGFAAVVAIVLFVIIDLEFPRLGIIRVDAADRVLLELRASMN
jgi:hypothetical protein